MIVLRILRTLIMLHVGLLRKAIRLYIRTRSLETVIRIMFHKKDIISIMTGYIDYVVLPDGTKYYMTKLINSVETVQEDYRFDDIRESDIVIDVGAGIGGFSIPASKKAKIVYAIEPMTPELVRNNVDLNHIHNIEVLPIALGDGQDTHLEWKGESKDIQTKTLSEIKEMCGGCDFLKVDCEGYEWSIKPEELKGIRRIEMEVHNVEGHRIEEMENRLSDAGLEYEIVDRPEGAIGLWLIHVTNKSI